MFSFTYIINKTQKEKLKKKFLVYKYFTQTSRSVKNVDDRDTNILSRLSIEIDLSH